MPEELSERKSQEGYEWQITEKVKETHDTYTYTLLPVSNSQRFNFDMGEFVTLSVLLKRPTSTGGFEENLVNRAYSIASSPTRDFIELTIKEEKPFGYINPITGKSDAFAAYFNQQVRIGDKITLKLSLVKEHFLWKVAAGIEKNVAYWSGANGAQSARSLIQYMEDKNDPDFNLVLFYSNTKLYIDKGISDIKQGAPQPVDSLNVIYYNWLINIAKKLENLKVIFTFTREEESPTAAPNDARIIYRKGRFFLNPDGSPERTLLKYGRNVETSFNPICGSSAFINGIVRLPNGKINRGKGILQNLIEIEGIKPEKTDKEQFYLEQVGANERN
jgi:NAD(P)H-flavin reductase